MLPVQPPLRRSELLLQRLVRQMEPERRVRGQSMGRILALESPMGYPVGRTAVRLPRRDLKVELWEVRGPRGAMGLWPQAAFRLLWVQEMVSSIWPRCRSHSRPQLWWSPSRFHSTHQRRDSYGFKGM